MTLIFKNRYQTQCLVIGFPGPKKPRGGFPDAEMEALRLNKSQRTFRKTTQRFPMVYHKHSHTINLASGSFVNKDGIRSFPAFLFFDLVTFGRSIVCFCAWLSLWFPGLLPGRKTHVVFVATNFYLAIAFDIRQSTPARVND